MKTLILPAVLALILHGLLFSLKGDWLSGGLVVMPEPKTLVLNMSYRAPLKAPAESSGGPSFKIPIQPEKKPANRPQKKSEPAKKAASPGVKEKKINPDKDLPSEPPSPPESTPIPEEVPDTSQDSPYGETDIKDSEGAQRGSLLWDNPPGDDQSGSQDNFDENEGSTSGSKSEIIYPLAYDDNPIPRYPRMAKHRGYEGLVLLRVLVSPEGIVIKTKIVKSSGYSLLDKAAERTVKNWRFKPGRIGSEKVKMWEEIPVRFKLQ